MERLEEVVSWYGMGWYGMLVGMGEGKVNSLPSNEHSNSAEYQGIPLQATRRSG